MSETMKDAKRRTAKRVATQPVVVVAGANYTRREAAGWLRVHPDTLRGLPIPRKKQGYRTVLYKGEDLIAYRDRLPDR